MPQIERIISRGQLVPLCFMQENLAEVLNDLFMWHLFNVTDEHDGSPDKKFAFHKLITELIDKKKINAGNLCMFTLGMLHYMVGRGWIKLTLNAEEYVDKESTDEVEIGEHKSTTRLGDRDDRSLAHPTNTPVMWEPELSFAILNGRSKKPKPGEIYSFTINFEAPDSQRDVEERLAKEMPKKVLDLLKLT